MSRAQDFISISGVLHFYPIIPFRDGAAPLQPRVGAFPYSLMRDTNLQTLSARVPK